MSHKKKCGCVIADGKDRAVRKGFELGGYVKEFCKYHGCADDENFSIISNRRFFFDREGHDIFYYKGMKFVQYQFVVNGELMPLDKIQPIQYAVHGGGVFTKLQIVGRYNKY